MRTTGMSRWHRPRCGVWSAGYSRYTVWCGQLVGGLARAGAFLGVDDIPDGLPVCGTCDGRAVGAGQETEGPADRDLLFSPRWLTPPRHCPGSRSYTLYTPMSGRVGRCLACGDLQPLRAMGGPYNGGYGIVQHPPGPALVGPCPFHGWRFPTADHGRVVCVCGRALTTPETPS
jgi:hypothetical protein